MRWVLLTILIMKSWKVVINYFGDTLEVIIEAKSYAEACLSAERIYSGCTINEISEIQY